MERTDETAEYREPYRPRIHFTPKFGWMNDPNGLFYRDGIWHMFYQHNPMGTGWGNIEWGHAVSTDLVHWSEKKPGICPENGSVIASGGAVVDSRNAAGFGKGAALLYFTEYPPKGNAENYDGSRFTQNLAVMKPLDPHSNCSGDNEPVRFRKNPLIPPIGCGNRDPQVVWCEEKNAYVLSLFLGDSTCDFVLFESTDLLRWKEFQRIELPGDGECPGLIPMTASDGTRQWVFTGAHGLYQTGKFLEGRFVPHKEGKGNGSVTVCGEPVKQVFGNRYAAQWFQNAPDGRWIRLAWNTLYFRSEKLSQQMSFPTETTLKKRGEEYLLCDYPVREIESLYVSAKEAEAFDLEITLENFLEGTIEFNFGNQSFMLNADSLSGKLGNVPFAYRGDEDGRVSLRLLYDIQSLELFLNGGETVVTAPAKKRDTEVAGDVIYLSENKLVRVTASMHGLRTIWE